MVNFVATLNEIKLIYSPHSQDIQHVSYFFQQNKWYILCSEESKCQVENQDVYSELNERFSH